MRRARCSGVAGEAGAWRYVALGTNGLSDMGRAPPAAGSPESRAEALFARAVRWLTRNESPTGEGLNVVVAHLADSYYFRHDAGTRSFFTRNFSGATAQRRRRLRERQPAGLPRLRQTSS
jgi:hypothetical protein